MSSVFIFDFDGTLIDTLAIKPFRDRQEWSICYSRLSETEKYNGVDVLLHGILSRGDIPTIVSHSPKTLVSRLAQYHKLPPCEIFGYHDFRGQLKPNPFLLNRIMSKYPQHRMYGVGDETKDAVFYNNAGIISICAGWNQSASRDAPWSVVAETPIDILKF
jgi:phosphoglycolate phosphatase-like HAD superfamily hydrolase